MPCAFFAMPADFLTNFSINVGLFVKSFSLKQGCDRADVFSDLNFLRLLDRLNFIFYTNGWVTAAQFSTTRDEQSGAQRLP